MKKVIIVLLLICFPLIVLAYPKGDVNADGKVSSADYLLIRKHILGTSKLTGDKATRGDVNADGKISAQDYLLIKKTILAGNSVSSNYLEAYFLNTYNRSSYKETYGGNEALIFRTNDGKYVLLDTGVKSTELKNAIYNGLKNLQNNTTVTIDYMIVSHMHNDHYGNAVNILNDSKINIKNLILKREKTSGIDEEIVAAANKNKVNVIESGTLKEGYSYSLGSNVKMYLFNVLDVYKNDDCDAKDYTLSVYANYSSSNHYAKTPDNKYIYVNGTDFLGNVNKINTSSKIEVKQNSDSKIKSRFYYTLASENKVSQCSSNANSLAVLFQVMTSSGNKYVYLPNDIQNNGYDVLGEYDKNYGVTIHGFSSSKFYSYKLVNGEPRFILKDNKLVSSTSTKTIKKASAYIAAKNIKESFKDVVGNITVYQQGHHGLNNYEEVVSLLKLNTSSVYAISPVGKNPKDSYNFHIAYSQYILGKTKIMFPGGKNVGGIKCIINASGKTTCANY